MGGWTALQRWGTAASQPMASERQPRAVTANPTANGNCVSVRLSIGTLKDASMVAYFSESSRSRLRSVSMSPNDRTTVGVMIVHGGAGGSQAGERFTFPGAGEIAADLRWVCDGKRSIIGSTMKPAKLQVAAVQMKFRSTIHENVQRIVEAIHSAARDGADVILFPECAITGYHRKFKGLKSSSVAAGCAAVARAARETRCNV